MTNEETTIWGIHAGRTGDAHNLFLENNLIAIGWSKAGDLTELKPNREAFKERLAETHPHLKPGAIPVSGGQLFRFVHEMKIGDVVVYPSKIDKQIYIGKVIGDYFFDEEKNVIYPNQRTVEWIKKVPRRVLSQGALYEIGSAISLFQVKNYSDEYFTIIKGNPLALEEEDAETIAYVADEIEQFTSDYILRTISRELKGHPFAEFVAHLMSKMGYKTRVSPEGPDGGIDIIAHRDELGFEPPIIKVQVKSTSGNIGDPIVSALYRKVESNEFGMIVNLGGYTKQAISFAQNKSNLRLVDGDELVGLIYSYYEELDSKYKSVLPLKRVYVPEAIADSQQ